MEETLTRLGKTFWNTTYRRMRRVELRRVDETLFGETSHEAAWIRTERRLTAEMEVHALQIRSGRLDLVPDFQRLRDELLHTRAPPSSMRTLLKRCTESACPGFLTACSDEPNRFVCQTCDTRTCTRCGERANPLHTCDENMVASRQMILRECKPCVRCQAPSVRIEGCPTMWCPHCNTFWNWDTERVIESRGANPHNPDHRASLVNNNRTRREIDDVPCGGLPDGIDVNQRIVGDPLTLTNFSLITPIVIAALDCIHASQRMRHWYPAAWNVNEVFRPVRLSYILGDISEVAYETTLERMERTFEFRREVGSVLELLVLSGADVFQRFRAGVDDVSTACISLNALREIADERMVYIGGAFQRKSPRLGTDWKWSGLRRGG